MRISVLALQGAFAEHEQMFRSLGAETFQVRQLSDWQQPKDALVLPGGESTTQVRLLNRTGLLEPIRSAITDGLPVFATCAGMILLATHENGKPRQGLATMHIDVCRNAYGRQLGSFHARGEVKGMAADYPMTFIRAPYVNSVLSPEAEILSTVEGRIVGVRQHNQFAFAFHPEVTDDTTLHQYFLNTITNN